MARRNPALYRLAQRRAYKRDSRGRFATTNTPSSDPGLLAAGRHRSPRARHPPAPSRAEAKAAERRLRAILGDRLHVRDIGDPAVRQHLVDIDRIPDKHKRRIAAHLAEYNGGGLYLAGTGNLLDVTGRDDIRERYAEHPMLRTAAGICFYRFRVAAIGNNPSISVSTAVHEMAHMLDDSLNWASVDPRLPFRRVVEEPRDAGMLDLFYAQPGHTGLQETFAEAYALWLHHAGNPNRNLEIAKGLGAPVGTPQQRAAAEDLGRRIAKFLYTV